MTWLGLTIAIVAFLEAGGMTFDGFVTYRFRAQVRRSPPAPSPPVPACPNPYRGHRFPREVIAHAGRRFESVPSAQRFPDAFSRVSSLYSVAVRL